MDAAELKKILQETGLHPSKDRGQNFLLDESVVDDMIAAAEVNNSDYIVEVGPGLGVLTPALAAKAQAVLAMELDHGIAKELRARIVPKHQNLTLFEGDALSKEAYRAKVAWLQGQPYKVVANVPYQITSKLLREFMESEPKPSKVVIMVQKEVAERACAKPGDLNLLALSVQVYSQPSILRLVPAESFYPKPEVDSAVLVCDLSKPHKDYQALSPSQRDQFWRLAKMGFSSKRKQLKNNMPLQAESFAKIGIAPRARAQELTIEQWCALATLELA